MEKFIIEGNTKLEGEVTISGAKNAAVAIIPATLLVNGVSRIENLPNIIDVKLFCEILKELGVKVTWIDENSVEIDATKIKTSAAFSDKVKKFRASYYLIGALLGRQKKATIGLPGGCNIGERPIDQHIKGFEALGARVDINKDIVSARTQNGELEGNSIYLDIVSVGATINIMLAATLAIGVTVIENAAKEPHIVDVANFLNTMGADIMGAGTDTIRIRGVQELKGNATYSVVPDQIETGTFMVAAVASQGNILIKNCIPKHMESLTAKLLEMGAEVELGGDYIRVSCDKRPKKVNIKTQPYPGFPTDLQSQMGVSLAISEGISIIEENIWDSRFSYTAELNNMGANISVEGKRAIFTGVKKLKGTAVTATDLRAGAALLIAGIIADGQTELRNISHIDRGYERIEEKFRKIGAKIKRTSEW